MGIGWLLIETILFPCLHAPMCLRFFLFASFADVCDQSCLRFFFGVSLSGCILSVRSVGCVLVSAQSLRVLVCLWSRGCVYFSVDSLVFESGPGALRWRTCAWRSEDQVTSHPK